ncbi:hypothetical protein [Larkinella humicola]|uniref:DUF4157 domain-containing protein n=1 Tax=Larkinella humicola TaxID=2607654 RepID=A0A5N1JHK2_9BACT|nr:hypothetical protein [Larkinella humicola]KAA9355189.1 hypothetical protein F0P93_11470 [Larkinella humicola]
MIIVRVPFLWVSGMALFPFVLVRTKRPDAVLLHHERIHLRQQLELGLLPFYVWYLLEYLIRRWQYTHHYDAYRNISFEREAFDNEHNLTYWKTRKWYGFLAYRTDKPPGGAV